MRPKLLAFVALIAACTPTQPDDGTGAEGGTSTGGSTSGGMTEGTGETTSPGVTEGTGASSTGGTGETETAGLATDGGATDGGATDGGSTTAGPAACDCPRGTVCVQHFPNDGDCQFFLECVPLPAACDGEPSCEPACGEALCGEPNSCDQSDCFPGEIDEAIDCHHGPS